MSEISVVSLVRRYLSEVVAGRDFPVLSEILVPDYRFDGGGTPVIGRDDNYIPMVSTYLTSEPTIDTAVHEIITDGPHMAVWLTKYTETPRAAWDAILIYRSHRDRLQRCWSEQDWISRRRQLKGEQPAPPAPSSSPAVWQTQPGEPDPEVEAVVAAWLTGNPDGAASHAGSAGTIPPVLQVATISVNCLFTAGCRFAFHVTHHGTYLDGLDGCADYRGRPAQLHLAGIGTVTSGTVTLTRVINDSTEMRRRLAAQPTLTGPRPRS